MCLGNGGQDLFHDRPMERRRRFCGRQPDGIRRGDGPVCRRGLPAGRHILCWRLCRQPVPIRSDRRAGQRQESEAGEFDPEAFHTSTSSIAYLPRPARRSHHLISDMQPLNPQTFSNRQDGAYCQKLPELPKQSIFCQNRSSVDTNAAIWNDPTSESRCWATGRGRSGMRKRRLSRLCWISALAGLLLTAEPASAFYWYGWPGSQIPPGRTVIPPPHENSPGNPPDRPPVNPPPDTTPPGSPTPEPSTARSRPSSASELSRRGEPGGARRSNR